ncbi:MAG: hypothetical protein DMG78_31415, partial [Acidobacteria bacterium]
TASGDCTWYIDKYIKRVGRLCESTGTADRDEAERYLLHRIRELRDIAIYGVRPRRKSREAAAKYLNDFARKSTIGRDAAALRDLEPYIGDLWLDQISNDSFNAYRNARQDLTIITRNTGLRDQELCRLQWTWEVRIPELDTSTHKRSVFVLPADFVKGKRPRVVVLNDYAQAILEELRGQHPRYVFTSQRGHSRRRVKHVIASGWRSARVRAAQKYRDRFGGDPPEGFRCVRVHDRSALTGAGVGLEEPAGPPRAQAAGNYDSLQRRRGRTVDPGGQPRPEPEQGLLHDLAAGRRLPPRPSPSQSCGRSTASSEGGRAGVLGTTPQNSLASFRCVRGRWWKDLVGADGLEPPTFAL